MPEDKDGVIVVLVLIDSAIPVPNLNWSPVAPPIDIKDFNLAKDPSAVATESCAVNVPAVVYDWVLFNSSTAATW